MRRAVMPLVVAAGIALLPAAAAADPGKGRGHGKGNAPDARPVVVIGAPSRHDRDDDRRHRDREDDRWRGDWDDDWRGFCPPGLARKDNGCQPPGQAKKNGFDPVVLDPVIVLPRVVAPLPRPLVAAPPPRRPSGVLITPAAVPVVVGQRYDGVRYVTDPYRYGLSPAPEGSRYGIIGNQLVRLDSRTDTVLALVRLVEAVLD